MYDLFRKIVAEWKGFEIPSAIERDIEIDFSSNSIIAIVGVRRAGKTYLMFNLIRKLIKEVGKDNILYIDFENPKLRGIGVEYLDEILVAFREIFKPKNDNKIFLFLDEIQNIDGWEKWVRALHNSGKYKILISGSSATLLSKEIASALRGRSINYEVYPFSFKEFLKAKNYSYDLDIIKYTEKKGEILNYLNEYLRFGGFPEVVLNSESLKDKIFVSYFDAIFHRDIVERYRVRNMNLLENFLMYLLNNNTNYISLGKMQKFFNTMGMKVSKKTLGEYLKYAKDVFFTYPIEIFSYKIKDRLQYPKKIYSIDVGFANSLSPSFSENTGRLYENIVFLHLHRMRLKKSLMGIYYWKDRAGRETDFVITDSLKPIKLIQVSYDISRPETMKREIKGLLKSMEEFSINEGLIITGFYSGEESYGDKHIKFVPLYEWLLTNS